MSNRISKSEYYLGIAKAVMKRGTCLRRNYGAVIVKNDRVVATGYSGSPRGMYNCTDGTSCIRIERNIPSGSNYELCTSVHAEMNALMSCKSEDMIGATLYLYGEEYSTGEPVIVAQPCSICDRMIRNSGISEVVSRNYETGALRIIDYTAE